MTSYRCETSGVEEGTSGVKYEAAVHIKGVSINLGGREGDKLT